MGLNNVSQSVFQVRAGKNNNERPGMKKLSFILKNTVNILLIINSIWWGVGTLYLSIFLSVDNSNLGVYNF